MGDGQAELTCRLAFRRNVAGGRDVRRRYGGRDGSPKSFMQMCLKNKSLKRERQRDGKREEASREPGTPGT